MISPFILLEPNIEDIKASVEDEGNIIVRFSRDAWQGAARLIIVEKYLGGQEFSLAELDSTRWGVVLREALTCPDENRDYLKRKTNQKVTLSSNGHKIEKDILPHLTIWTFVSMDGDIEENLKGKIAQMTPIYNWVVSLCAPKKHEQFKPTGRRKTFEARNALQTVALA